MQHCKGEAEMDQDIHERFYQTKSVLLYSLCSGRQHLPNII